MDQQMDENMEKMTFKKFFLYVYILQVLFVFKELSGDL